MVLKSRLAEYVFSFTGEHLEFRSPRIETIAILATFVLPLLLFLSGYMADESVTGGAERIWSITLALAVAIPVIAFFWGRDVTIGYALFVASLLVLWHFKNYGFITHLPLAIIASYSLVKLASQIGGVQNARHGEFEQWKLHIKDLEAELHFGKIEAEEVAARSAAMHTLTSNLARLASSSFEIERSLNLAKVAESIAVQVNDIFGRGRTLVYQFHGDTSVLLHAIPPCLSAEAGSGDDFNFIVRRRRQNLLIPNIAHSYQVQPQVPSARAFNALMMVPLIVEHDVWGVLRVESDHADDFDRDDLSALWSLAAPAALSLNNAHLFSDLEIRAVTDGLTGLYRRHYFDRRMDSEFARARRLKSPLSLIFLDIDHFKSINDRYGHTQGDAVLRLLAECLTREVKSRGMVARYGGEEFVVLLPEITRELAAQIAEDIRAAVMTIDVPGLSDAVTISAGVADFRASATNMPTGEASPLQSPTEFVERADTALYAAKKSGRNRVVTAPS